MGTSTLPEIVLVGAFAFFIICLSLMLIGTGDIRLEYNMKTAKAFIWTIYMLSMIGVWLYAMIAKNATLAGISSILFLAGVVAGSEKSR